VQERPGSAEPLPQPGTRRLRERPNDDRAQGSTDGPEIVPV